MPGREVGGEAGAEEFELTPKPSLTYRRSGVDVAAGEGFVHRIRGAVRSTHASQEGRVLGGPADFAGLFHLAGMFQDPVLVSGTDGVGTKLKLAQRLGRHDTVGIDLVAMCVNDVLTTGAVPLFFLDYIVTGRLEEETLAAVVEGVAEGCRRAGCALLGGETAEMPDFYEPGVYDLAGFAVGAAERGSLIDAKNLSEGDVLIGLPSSGLHSNGFSLVRRIFRDEREWTSEEPHPELGRPLGEELLLPTRIYARPLGILRAAPGVKGMAHITGGGLPGNLRRILPEGMQARLDPPRWPQPPIFGLCARRGPVEAAEMYATFNMGIGFIVAAESSRAESLAAELRRSGEAAYLVGEVRRRSAAEPAVLLEGV